MALLIPTFAKYLTDGFRLAKMHVDFPNHPEWEFPLEPKILAVLDQPFRYLGKGSQCYVFESRDQKYVIKFFRFNDPRSELKIFTVFNAARIAYEYLKEETGLIYIHLNLTKIGLPTLHCKDAIGRSYQLPLDQCRFAIQKKAIGLEEALKWARQDPNLMKKRLDQFIDLLRTRTEKGIFNSDPSLSRNFGFLEDQAIEIDFGCFRPTSSLSKKEEMDRYASKLRQFLKKEAPEWIEYFDSQTSKN